MKIKGVILILTTLLVGCSGMGSGSIKKVKSIELPKHRIEQKLINYRLRKVIINYINEVDGSFFDKEWLYYSLFFFYDGGKFYFTIWTFTGYPNFALIKEYENQKYIHSLYLINNRKVIFLYPADMQLKGLFISTNQNIYDAKTENEKPYFGPIYDGDIYFKTYEITQFEGQWNFNKIERVNVVFLKLQPPANYLH